MTQPNQSNHIPDIRKMVVDSTQENKPSEIVQVDEGDVNSFDSRLDEILEDFYDGDIRRSDMGKAKQSLLDWHNKQIEAVLDRLKLPLKGYRTHRIGSHSDDWGGESDRLCFCDLEAIIEAERNKLKEVK